MMELAERGDNGRIDECRRSLAVCRYGDGAGGHFMLPSSRGAKAQNQLAERRIGVVDMGRVDRNKLVGQLAGDATKFVSVGFEVPDFGGFQVCRNRRPAGVIEPLGV